jgi:multidrug efflux pump subunit AcrA (membrane-fusion protein)
MAALVAGCQEGDGDDRRAAPPAEIHNRIAESLLTTLSLTPATEPPLATEPARRGTIPGYEVYGGEAMVSFGREVTVSAPIAGTVARPAPVSTWPRAGVHVRQDVEILRLLPVVAGQREVLSPADRISLADARYYVQFQRELAESHIRILEPRLKEERLSEATLETSRILLDEAKEDLEVLEEMESRMQPGEAAPLALAAPFDGVLQYVFVAENDAVAAGAPLFQLADLDPLWIRVPVYAGRLDRLATDANATVGSLGRSPDLRFTVAPIPAPPSADPLATTVDLYYELSNPHARVRPGQRVAVTIPTRNRQEVVLVSRRGVVQDVQGNSWVYEKTAPHTYVRRRVSVIGVVEDAAALSAGIAAGDEVVTEGAIDLFGLEFGEEH